VASFSNRLSLQQVRQLIFCRPALREVVLARDWDSWLKAKNAARHLAPVLKAGAVRLPEGQDPDSLGNNKVRKLEVWWA